MYEDRNGTDIYYYYDSYGTPTAIRYYEADGTSHRFFLATNQQGDIIGLYNASGNLVVKYEYDAWGNIISETNATGGTPTSLAQKWSDINPFRYRSYYYDAETGLYYLNSRYYDSETGRFLNADDTSVINATPNALTDKNLFSYCDNNPVMREDNGGAFWDIVLDVVSIVASAIEVVKNPDDAGAWVGLALDVVDVAIPTGGGLGEAYDAYRVYDKGKDALRHIDVDAATKKILGSIKEAAGKLGKGDNDVYVSVFNGTVEYVGITNDFMRRTEEWKGTRDIIKFASGLDRNSARIVEQTIIDVFVMDKYGGSLANKINSIGVKNPLFNDYLNFLGTVKF